MEYLQRAKDIKVSCEARPGLELSYKPSRDSFSQQMFLPTSDAQRHSASSLSNASPEPGSWDFRWGTALCAAPPDPHDWTVYTPGTLVYVWSAVDNIGWEVGEVLNPADLPIRVEVLLHGVPQVHDVVNVRLASPKARMGVNDIVGAHGIEVTHLHEASLLDNLRVRRARGDLYTWCSPHLLLALCDMHHHPFRDSPLSMHGATLGVQPSPDAAFSPARERRKYVLQGIQLDRQRRTVGPWGSMLLSARQDTIHGNSVPHANLPLHAYSSAEKAFVAMVEERRDQVVVIGGDSSTGKAECAQHVVQYLVDRSEAVGKAVPWLARRVVLAGHILNSFGCASTELNTRSSRYGSCTTMCFDQASQQLVGARLSVFAVERSRVTTQRPGEGNFNVFYQLCAGASDQEVAQFALMPPDHFFYLAQGGQVAREYVDDAAQFEALKLALLAFGITQQEMTCIFRLLAGILHLGNVCFEDDLEGVAKLLSPQELSSAARLMRVPVLQMEQCITQTADGGGLDAAAAIEASNTLARGMYCAVFNWLVRRMNACMKEDQFSSPTSTNIISVLNPCGFESLTKNSIEQLCMNYVDEWAHQLFIEGVVHDEVRRVQQEGLSSTKAIKQWESNLGKLSVLEKVLDALDLQATKKRGGEVGADLEFCEQSKNILQEGGQFPTVCSTCEADTFSVQHTKGVVVYSGYGSVVKNRTALPSVVVDVVRSSTSSFVRALLFRDAQQVHPQTACVGCRGWPSSTLASGLLSSLRRIASQLKGARQHWIVCISTSSQRGPDALDSLLVLRQLSAAKITDIAKWWNDLSEEVFLCQAKYTEIHMGHNGWCGPPPLMEESKAYVMDLLWQLDPLYGSDWFVLGSSTIFMRETHLINLLHVRTSSARLIQASYRGMRCRKVLLPQQRLHLHSHAMARRIQHAWGAFSGAKSLRLEAGSIEKAAQNVAAARIQAAWRGWVLRSGEVVAALRAEKYMRILAAVTIQRWARVFLEVKAKKRWAQKKLNADRERARASLLQQAAQTAIKQEAERYEQVQQHLSQLEAQAKKAEQEVAFAISAAEQAESARDLAIQQSIEAEKQQQRLQERAEAEELRRVEAAQRLRRAKKAQTDAETSSARHSHNIAEATLRIRAEQQKCVELQQQLEAERESVDDVSILQDRESDKSRCSLVATPSCSSPTATCHPPDAPSTSNPNPTTASSHTKEQAACAPLRSTNTQPKCTTEDKPGTSAGTLEAGTADLDARSSQPPNQTPPAVTLALPVYAPYSHDAPARSFMELIETDTHALNLLGLPNTKHQSDGISRPFSRGEQASDGCREDDCQDDIREWVDAELLGSRAMIDTPEAQVAREMSHIEKYTRSLEREVEALKRAQCLDMEDPDVRVEFWKAETRAARATVYVCMAKESETLARYKELHRKNAELEKQVARLNCMVVAGMVQVVDTPAKDAAGVLVDVSPADQPPSTSKKA